MEASSPSLKEWKDLYDSAVKFRELASWKWMWDANLFGVKNPGNGEIGYCCIMGSLGEHYALGVYLGTEGLEVYHGIQSGKFHPDEALVVQKCLMASFEDRKLLQKQDMQIIKELGLKFRGRNAWPMFRNYTPGYYPWFLNAEEARFLTLALHQAMDVALRVKEDAYLLDPPRENQHLVRVAEGNYPNLTWKDQWLEPEPLKKLDISVEPSDEVLLKRINKKTAGQAGAWEIDVFFVPMPVKEEGRPFFPCAVMIADHRTGMILYSDISKAFEYRANLREQFLNVVERLGSLPTEILVAREDVFELLDPLASRLKMKVRLVNKLKAIEEARSSMFGFLRSRS